jgi:hypothetical protein
MRAPPLLLSKALIPAFDAMAAAETEAPIPLPLGTADDNRTPEERHWKLPKTENAQNRYLPTEEESKAWAKFHISQNVRQDLSGTER